MKDVVIVTHSDSGVNEAYVDSLVVEQRQRWAKDGVGPDFLDVLCLHYKNKVLSGHAPRAAARQLFVEVEEAKAETWLYDHTMAMSKKFHIPFAMATELVNLARKHFHRNARPEFNKFIAPVYVHIQNASKEAYLQRRMQQSTMAAALVKSGVEA